MEKSVVILGIILILSVLVIIKLVKIISDNNKTIETIRKLWENDKDVETMREMKKELDFWVSLAWDLGYYIDPDLNKFNEFYKENTNRYEENN